MQRKYIITLSSENQRLRKISLNTKELNNISIEILDFYSTEGVIKYDTKLYFAPVDWSPSLCRIKKSTKVTLLEKARVESRNWYHIEIPSSKRINSRGWVVSEDILTVEEKNLLQEKYNRT
ncbi:hypothetical protein [Clostridium polynesiense]|uniref:hypothetical protein n=1 Tax=Clostridium polynesiense TaxID=1325933 RepID=UPI0011CBB08B|nr:hypothetical protein [Clostridium polynesiense]